jgi:hypothetical protein
VKAARVLFAFALGLAACDGIAGIQQHFLTEPQLACLDAAADGGLECVAEGDAGGVEFAAETGAE